MEWSVSSHVSLEVTQPAELVFAVSVADRGDGVEERMTLRSDGRNVPFRVVPERHGTRLHLVDAPVGRLEMDYAATVIGEAHPHEATESERIEYLRPSRYAPSDELAAVAAAEFGGVEDPAEIARAVSSWVGTQLGYVSGSSRPTDGAVQTLLSRQGVCRDFAHLCVALLRARNVPARLAAVYAPGLDPMDFHAVAEAAIDGRWCVFDATTLAPRPSLLRIATGRDAADTAFLTVLSGRADLIDISVSAVVDRLPSDDLDRLVAV